MEILDVIRHLTLIYGLNMSQSVNAIAFGESDMNVPDMICDLFKLVIQKTDQTSIDLTDRNGPSSA